MMENDHPVACLKLLDIPAGSHHYTRGFVAVYARRRQQIVFDFLEIRVANPAGLHAHKQFTGADFGRRYLLDSDDAIALIDCGPHSRGDRDLKIGNWQ